MSNTEIEQLLNKAIRTEDPKKLNEIADALADNGRSDLAASVRAKACRRAIEIIQESARQNVSNARDGRR